MQPDKQPQLSSATIVIMVVVALIFDGFQTLFSYIGLGWLIIPIAYGTFILWFKLLGLDFLTMKRSALLGVGAALEMLTAGIIPAMTFMVLRIALDYRIKKTVGI